MKRELEIARCGLALRSLKMGCDNLLEFAQTAIKKWIWSPNVLLCFWNNKNDFSVCRSTLTVPD